MNGTSDNASHDHQIALDAPSDDLRQRYRQHTIVRNGYMRISREAPNLRNVDASLVATDMAIRCIADTKAALLVTRRNVAAAREEKELAESKLGDANACTQSLEARIALLESKQQARSTKSPSQLVEEELASVENRQQQYDAEFQHIESALRAFINETLGPAIAAEELGGPTVGELVDIDDDMLAAGFSHSGKPKRSKQGKPTLDRRQRRIDEIWGATTTDADESLDEKGAASAELLALVDRLLRASLGESDGGEYVELDRDSAASRFLVRAKVAQFHPNNAKRLRLVDSGRTLSL